MREGAATTGDAIGGCLSFLVTAIAWAVFAYMVCSTVRSVRSLEYKQQVMEKRIESLEKKAK